ncbi:MAG TPA: hydroxysqualene dehydroxylase HpnE [Ktedonobacterales bacterium]|nr:hydroxysqualene dehydroxylase HpnE [Ktedonobacterales bacterium]
MPGIDNRVIVIGGGLAGIAAACDLADAGQPVTLIEARPFLGGKTWSFRDDHTGMTVDNGQHVFLGCCAAYRHFVERLGIEQHTRLQERLRVPILDGQHKPAALKETRLPLPAPLHLLPSFLRLPMLSWQEKLRAGRTLLAIRRAGQSGRSAYDTISFADWLRERGESQRAITYLWNLITLATINEDCERASAGLALVVFQEGLLRRTDGGRIGYATVGLSDLICQAATRYLLARGASIQLGCRGAGLEIKDAQLTGIRLMDGELIPASQAIVALPQYLLASLLPPEYRSHPFFARAARLGTSPIVGVNLWLDRPVMREPLAAVIRKHDTYWVFDKGALLGEKLAGGQYLTISISGAHRYLDHSREQIINHVREELEAVFPTLREAQIVHTLVIKERQATFSAAPGSLANRLPTLTPLPGLYVAGAWTDTDWPATMEGAIRSGQRAAQAAIHARQAGIYTYIPLPVPAESRQDEASTCS